ncbi:hypothetical protein BDV33DRAFT_169354 [Aspergillus novoparasiticus]|uniref:Uncharacterized protein n=1 Tax=Aspergillus novoparasiticus TaxID=986946 RepID=A0A5N6EZM6_9EURO|nr:hypothetical protein BDV33DRAFT_169354 [Aspergillus novoparasiticus]
MFQYCSCSEGRLISRNAKSQNLQDNMTVCGKAVFSQLGQRRASTMVHTFSFSF